MLPADPLRYDLTPRAVADLEEVWRYGAETWSVAQADLFVDDLVALFQLIASAPEMARERAEFSPPVRIHAHRDQLIVYRVEPDHILIIRILGGATNWQAVLNRMGSV